MKNFLFLLLFGLFFSACQKEHQSPEEQLITALEEKANVDDKPIVLFLMKNETLCGKIDCEIKVLEEGNTTVRLLTKEGLFMRGIKWHFEVKEWVSAPEVVARSNRGQILTDQQVEHKCRGN